MRFLKKYFPMSAKGWLIYFVAMGLASALCALLQKVSTSDVHVPMIFVLMVLIIALMTDGYFYGFLAAVTSVIAVNWAFTYPYAELNFTIYGYPLTFVTMLAVGFAVSTLAVRVKEQNRIKFEAEQEKMRANLLRAISHDLRTPLASISGAISAVLDSGDSLSNAQRLELLSDARKDADWLYRMVENLLSITRISGDKPGAIKKEDEVLEEVLSEVVVKFKKKNPEIFTQKGELKANYKQAERIIARMERDPLFMQYMSGEKQVIMTGELFGAEWKIKIDSFVRGIAITDLKVMASITKLEWVKDIGYLDFVRYWGYDIQGAIYQEIVYQNTGERPPFYIAAGTKEEEPNIEVIHVTQNYLDEAKHMVEMNMPRILRVKNGEAEPDRCEMCDCCRHTKVLKRPISITNLVAEI